MRKEEYFHLKKEQVIKQIGNIFVESNSEFDFEIKIKELWNCQQCMNWEDFHNEVNKVCWIF